MEAYLALKIKLLDQIQSGQYKIGDRIPTELELCRQFNVSRITACRAVKELVAAGYLVRQRGRGTTVNGTNIKEGVTRLMSFSERMRAMAMHCETRELEKGRIIAPIHVRNALDLAPGSEIILLKRLRVVDDNPLCISYTYLMPDKFNWVLDVDFTRESLYYQAETIRGMKIGDGWQNISVGFLPDPNDHQLLNVNSSDPCLKIELVCNLADGNLAHMDTSYYAGDRYTLRQHLTR